MIEVLFIVIALLLVLSVTASKISDRFGIPSLLLFLVIGMLAGSEGVGGIYFDNPTIAHAIGVFALVIILFSGGLDTEWQSVQPVLKEAVTLSTFGVLLTAIILGYLVKLVFEISYIEGMLIAAITSSTDAAAVFALLRSRGVALQERISALLELESGSNDPMAVFLTVGLIQLILNPHTSVLQLFLFFIQQMLIGTIMGLLAGKLIPGLLKNIKLGYKGLYSVLVLSLLLLTFGLTNILKGSGFLAVYIVGLMLGRQKFFIKQFISHFFDGMAWLMQVIMFLTLGLFVFPSRLIPIAIPGIILSLALMFVARPISVWVSTIPYRLSSSEKTFVAWVGLRGAVPIILAIYPKIEGLDHGDMIFNLIFFVVLTSLLIQGTTIAWSAKLLRVDK